MSSWRNCRTRRRRQSSRPAGRQPERAEPGAVGRRHRRRHARQHADAVHQRGHRVLRDVVGERVARLDVDEQPGAVVGEGATDRTDHADRIGHVVDAVEGGDEPVRRRRRAAARREGRRSGRSSAPTPRVAPRRGRVRSARCRSRRSGCSGTPPPSAAPLPRPRTRCRRRRCRRSSRRTTPSRAGSTSGSRW